MARCRRKKHGFRGSQSAGGHEPSACLCSGLLRFRFLDSGALRRLHFGQSPLISPWRSRHFLPDVTGCDTAAAASIDGDRPEIFHHLKMPVARPLLNQVLRAWETPELFISSRVFRISPISNGRAFSFRSHSASIKRIGISAATSTGRNETPIHTEMQTHLAARKADATSRLGASFRHSHGR